MTLQTCSAGCINSMIENSYPYVFPIFELCLPPKKMWNAQTSPTSTHTHSPWLIHHGWIGQGCLPTLLHPSQCYPTWWGSWGNHQWPSFSWLQPGPDNLDIPLYLRYLSTYMRGLQSEARLSQPFIPQTTQPCDLAPCPRILVHKPSPEMYVHLKESQKKSFVHYCISKNLDPLKLIVKSRASAPIKMAASRWAAVKYAHHRRFHGD